MSWRWNNPPQDEALEAYEYYKNKYYRAANQKQASERKEKEYISQKKTANSKLNQINSQRVNLEKRLRGVEELIKIMEGNGGWFQTNVPKAIEKARKDIGKADESFRKSIVLSGTNAASLNGVFRTKTVAEDANSAAALSGFAAEKQRLEQQLSNFNAQIASLSGQITSLQNKINACNSEQSSLRSTMNSCLYDMNHYKKYI